MSISTCKNLCGVGGEGGVHKFTYPSKYIFASCHEHFYLKEFTVITEKSIYSKNSF